MTQISPSLLSADFGHLHSDIDMLNASEAAMLHLDVMDGVFVPNISFGFPVIETIAKYARKPLDVHLMIVDPDRYISQVRDCGASIMNVHIEATKHLHRVVQQIRQAGMKPAVTLCPATPVELLRDILPDLDMVLLMSVNPGFGGQKFIPGTIAKIQRLASLISETSSHAIIQIDGGINLSTGSKCVAAGAQNLVAGSFVFSSPDPSLTIKQLSEL